jgi:hypothetical protein
MHSNLFAIKYVDKILNWLLIHENINGQVRNYGHIFINIKEKYIIISSSKQL